MKRNQKLPELLAPAGDADAFLAAVAAGADAIYIGGEHFGARAFAKNFSRDEMSFFVKYAHFFGVRVYVTLNTLIYDKEIDEALEYARYLQKIGVDALIVADLGIAALIRRKIPELELHASTQMGVHNTEGVNFAKRLGCKRVVLARECSHKDIRRIVDNSLAECEVFVHGALCVCHSGQCLFSSLVGGRSGNRGECAQPCRLPYNNKYPLSLKDYSLAEHVSALIESGVSSLKIEGRMKSADYVYEVTSVYRGLLDSHRNANQGEMRRLSDIFSRNGFTDGYFVGNIEKKMTGVRTEEEKNRSREISGGEFSRDKLPIRAAVKMRSGSPIELTLTAAASSRWDGIRATDSEKCISVTVSGSIPEPAQSSPVTIDTLRARLAKMGNTPFSLLQDDIVAELDSGLNLPPSAINALRRDAAEALENAFARPLDKLIGASGDAVESPSDFELKGTYKKVMNTALFFKEDVLRTVLQKRPELLFGIDTVFVPLFDYKSAAAACEGINIGVYLPPVISESEWSGVANELSFAKEGGARFALVGNVSQIELVKQMKLVPVSDFRLNITNKYTAAYLEMLGVDMRILSPELTLPMARDIGGSVITLGRIPLMLTERCFIKENFGCNFCTRAAFEDRKGAKFPIMREYPHRNVIFNSTHTYMGDKQSELSAAGLRSAHFIFSTESADECISLLSAYGSGEPLAIPHRRMGKR